MANKDLASYEWFHGPISRQAAVGQLERDGDFLVRDCISAPGDYVLTCMAMAGKVIHFRLNRVVDQDQVLYQFEGDCFPTVADLIIHHLSTGLPVSSSSQAVISKPRFSNQNQGGIYARLNPINTSSDRSQSSMSGDTTSTVSSSGSSAGKVTTTNLAKSGSRASLLKDVNQVAGNGGVSNSNHHIQPGELKRFKSLPGGKIRRVKRRAPSPPKNQKPLPSLHDRPEEQRQQQQQLSLPLDVREESSNLGGGSLERKRNSFLQGVKLRRKKFKHIIQKPLNLSQRQSMHVTHLQEYLSKVTHFDSNSLSVDKRRYSMPRLLDEEAPEETTTILITNNKLVRSPSDTSLLYLSQLGLSQHHHWSPCRPIVTTEPLLPTKKRPVAATCRVPTVNSQVNGGSPGHSLQQETVYDCLPRPRPCLTDDQIRFNEIYDVPRKLLTPQQCVQRRQDQNDKFYCGDGSASSTTWLDPRSVSAFGVHNRTQSARNNHRKSSHCQSVSGTRSVKHNGGLSRHRNIVDLNKERDHAKPALPPKSRVSKYKHQEGWKGGGTGGEDYYADPKSLIMSSKGDDCISLCSSFSYCSECTNTTTGPIDDTLSLLSAAAGHYSNGASAVDLRFSPTSLLSEDTLSFQDYEDDSLSYLEVQREISCRSSRRGCSRVLHDMAAMSTLSSVSSITLQGDDISLGYDTTSLPEDPFPQGLPSSASSTIGSPPSSW
jgi:hypothetical protein